MQTAGLTRSSLRSTTLSILRIERGSIYEFPLSIACDGEGLPAKRSRGEVCIGAPSFARGGLSLQVLGFAKPQPVGFPLYPFPEIAGLTRSSLRSTTLSILRIERGSIYEFPLSIACDGEGRPAKRGRGEACIWLPANNLSPPHTAFCQTRYICKIILNNNIINTVKHKAHKA
jgi:hypothetical protein